VLQPFVLRSDASTDALGRFDARKVSAPGEVRVREGEMGG